ncbi:hypothetical protein M406DRAFT_74153 [Cryphonectria parasitica EP155]|uniref:Uncharacterized protein n=1 Tax=Cryphonectria parasitica (strain ATCC 38755 / EP155) TaxID=660469 RepID=A0A9P5CLQ2_CRYP1|nr:uncharacterized protein M406DRAFT_74153 [Cryphonectria parasitica EP155]KAF3763564.1 hypothetical protein M406DRAFT_74153 [Cryphonectria parasitica EP155]
MNHMSIHRNENAPKAVPAEIMQMIGSSSLVLRLLDSLRKLLTIRKRIAEILSDLDEDHSDEELLKRKINAINALGCICIRMQAMQTAAEPREAASTEDTSSSSVFSNARTLLADLSHIESSDFTASHAEN